MRRLFALVLALHPVFVSADGRDMEQFTHVAGVNLSDYLQFDDIAKRFGKADIVRSGDAAEYLGMVCYLTKERDAVLEFNESELYRGYEIRVPNGTDGRCRETDFLEPKALEVAGIRLGMSREAFGRVIGPLQGGPKKLVHQWHYIYKKGGVEWHVYINMRTAFANGLLQSFAVSRGSSD